RLRRSEAPQGHPRRPPGVIAPGSCSARRERATGSRGFRLCAEPATLGASRSALMIAYETLVQAINDWRAGKRPTALTVSRPPSRSVLAANRSVADEGYDELEIDEANDLSDYGDDGGVYDEAADDFAVFDPANDLHAYLLAEARIEHAWVD